MRGAVTEVLKPLFSWGGWDASSVKLEIWTTLWDVKLHAMRSLLTKLTEGFHSSRSCLFSWWLEITSSVYVVSCIFHPCCAEERLKRCSWNEKEITTIVSTNCCAVGSSWRAQLVLLLWRSCSSLLPEQWALYLFVQQWTAFVSFRNVLCCLERFHLQTTLAKLILFNYLPELSLNTFCVKFTVSPSSERNGLNILVKIWLKLKLSFLKSD